MSRQLRLEDLKWTGTNSQRFSFSGNDVRKNGWEMILMEPVIDFEEFQFTIKIHSLQASYFMVGVCDVNHSKKYKETHFGSRGGIGWGWNRKEGVYGPNISDQYLREKYGKKDLVTVSVNRNKKTLEFLKNKVSAGKLKNLDFPKDLVIAVSLYNRVDFEVIEFSCKTKVHVPPPPPTKGEVEMIIKAMEERFVTEMKKEHEENKKLLEEMKHLMLTQVEQERQKNEELRKDHEELKKKYISQKHLIEGLEVKYSDHFEVFHRTNYSLKTSITPQMMMSNNDQVNFCFENDIFSFRFDFSIQSGPGSDNQNSPINLEGVKILMNGEQLSRFKIADNMIEFEQSLTKIGRNDLTCLFHNIKKTFLIDVEPNFLCIEKCDLMFYKAEVEPNGEFTRYSDQSTEKFSSSDIIQVFLKLVNENGVPLPPKFLKDECLEVKLIKIEGRRRKRINEVLSRDHKVRIDKVDEKNGEFCVCSIGENKLEKGTSYEVKVDGVEIEGLKKVFLIE